MPCSRQARHHSRRSSASWRGCLASRHDERRTDLARALRRARPPRHLGDTGQLSQHGLDFGGVDVVATADVHLRDAAAQPQVAVFADGTEVARGEPSPRRRGPPRRRLRLDRAPGGEVADIAAQHRLGPQPDPSHLAGPAGVPSSRHAPRARRRARAGPRWWPRSRRRPRVASRSRATTRSRCSARPPGTPGGPAWPVPARAGHATLRSRRSAGAKRRRAARSGWASIKAHWVGTPCPTVTRSEPATRWPSRRPRLRGDHGGDAVRDLVPGAGHVADVGEGQRRQAPVTGTGQHVGARRHGRKGGMVNTAPLGTPVDPLVHTMATGWCSSSAHEGGQRAPTRREARDVPTPFPPREAPRRAPPCRCR